MRIKISIMDYWDNEDVSIIREHPTLPRIGEVVFLPEEDIKELEEEAKKSKHQENFRHICDANTVLKIYHSIGCISEIMLSYFSSMEEMNEWQEEQLTKGEP